MLNIHYKTCSVWYMTFLSKCINIYIYLYVTVKFVGGDEIYWHNEKIKNWSCIAASQYLALLTSPL